MSITQLQLAACVVLVWASNVHASNVDVRITKITYGKYYTKGTDGSKTEANNFYLFSPSNKADNSTRLPIVIEIHGGGFTGGSATKYTTAQIQSLVNNGIAYISVDYRLVATKYYYDTETDTALEEELIHVDKDGKLTLDSTGKTMDSYEIRIGRQEYNTKCSYDAAQMIERVIEIADQYHLDVHRISTTGGSAGGGEIHYLTWVYHQWNVGRYTPVGMVYTMAQLDYPVQNMLDRTWGLWADDVGEDTKLSKILSKADCGMIIGNPWCTSGRSDYNLCNKSWNDASLANYCGESFDDATLGQLRSTQVWPSDDPDVGKGMEILWYNSLNMQKHAPKPFHLYIANYLNSTAGMNVVHNALYSRNYAKYAEMAGIDYTVYYTDYNGMTAQDSGTDRVSTKGGAVVYNYQSSHQWRDSPAVQQVAATSTDEQLLYHCLVFGLKNCATAPSPSPAPPAALSTACKKAIDAYCPDSKTQTYCQTCIRQNARTLLSDGCPPGHEGGAAACTSYCESQA